MKTLTIPGKHYIVRSSTGCTVTQETSPGKYITASVPADEDTPVFAHTGKFDIDDEGAVVTEVFNSAPYQKLRLLGVVGGNDGLPSGYTQLAYLENTGSQYIYTEYVPNNKTGIYSEWCHTASCNGHDFGVKESDSVMFINVRYSMVGSSGFGWGQWTAPAEWRPGLYTKIYSEMNFLNCRKVKINASTLTARSWGLGQLNATLTKGLYLFNGGYPYSGNQYRLIGRIYTAKISQETEIVHDFVPTLDKTGTPCMFDLVTRQPFPNNGSGQFIAGIETQEQLDAMLRRLPNRTGQDVGTLQVRLAEALQTPENEAKLDAMLAKNWEISQAA